MAARNPRFGRDALHALVALGVLGLLAKTWLVAGLVSSLRVSSGSMAPHLLGPHCQFDCTRCGHPFVCNRDSLPPDGPPMCPNCGAADSSSARTERAGDRVLVDRSAFLWRQPRRWEVVVLRSPEAAGELCVKRVAGLPGETVEIRAGRVWVGEAPARKSVAERRAMAIPVYALPARADGAQDAADRWQCDPASAWQFADGRFAHRALPDESVGWLAYRHRHGLGTVASERDLAILDESPCDAAESRLLNPVSNLMLRCRITAAETVQLRAGCSADPVTIELDFRRASAAVFRQGAQGSTVELPRASARADALWELVLADQRLQLIVDDRVVVEQAYEPSPGDPGAGAWMLAIGAGGEASIRELQVLRDIYYTSATPARPGERCQYQLGPDEYFLLGDNSPHSRDSRVWSRATGIHAAQIMGRALKW